MRSSGYVSPGFAMNLIHVKRLRRACVFVDIMSRSDFLSPSTFASTLCLHLEYAPARERDQAVAIQVIYRCSHGQVLCAKYNAVVLGILPL